MRNNLSALAIALIVSISGCGIDDIDRVGDSTGSTPTSASAQNGLLQEEDLQSQTSTSADIYVDPVKGNDLALGASSTEPVQSLARAKTLVRELKAREPAKQSPIVVMLRGGTHTLTETLAFGTQDSGTVTSPVIYRAYPNEQPLISGGTVLKGWQVDADGRWQLGLPEVVRDGWVFTQLWSDGQRRYRPRLPKNDYRYIKSKVPPLNATNDNRFGFEPGELDPSWHNLTDVEVLAWQWWGIARLRIAQVDVANSIVSFTGQVGCARTWCKLEPKRRYIVENVREALTEAGEWYLDSTTGRLTYLPFPGERPDETTIIVPRLKTLMRIQGDGLGAQVAHISFDGIAFAHTHWATPAAGNNSGQAENGMGAAIELRYANDIRFSKCSIEHTGNYGIAIRDDSHRNRIEGCLLSDLGAGGIRVGTTGGMANEAQVTSHNVIRDNLITTGGRMHPAGVGVLIQRADHNTVEHNDIFDFYYTGISVGWSWGYGAGNAHHNDIGYNHVKRIGQGVLSDMGGIYTLGVQRGAHVHHNILQDISRNRYGGWGIYADEGSSDIVYEKNLVHSTQDAPFNLNWGRNLSLINNVFVAGKERRGVLERNRKEESLTITARYNIFVSNHPEALRGDWSDGHYLLDFNLYWNAEGVLPQFSEQTVNGRVHTFSSWQAKGQDANSLMGDPLFIDPAQQNYSLGAASPALALGIDAIDLSTTGRLSSPRADELPPAPRAFPGPGKSLGIAPPQN